MNEKEKVLRLELLDNIDKAPIKNQTYFKTYKKFFTDLVLGVEEAYNKTVETITKTEWIAYLKSQSKSFSASSLSKSRVMLDQYLYDLEQSGLIMANRYKNLLKTIKVSDITNENKYKIYYHRDPEQHADFINYVKSTFSYENREIILALAAICVLFYEGVYAEEMYDLTRDQIDFENKKIILKDREIPLIDKELNILKNGIQFGIGNDDSNYWLREHFSVQEDNKPASYKTKIYTTIQNINFNLKNLPITNEWSGKQIAFLYTRLSGEYYNMLLTIAEKENLDIDNLKISMRSRLTDNQDYIELYESAGRKSDFLSWTDCYYPVQE